MQRNNIATSDIQDQDVNNLNAIPSSSSHIIESLSAIEKSPNNSSHSLKQTHSSSERRRRLAVNPPLAKQKRFNPNPTDSKKEEKPQALDLTKILMAEDSTHLNSVTPTPKSRVTRFLHQHSRSNSKLSSPETQLSLPLEINAEEDKSEKNNVSSLIIERFNARDANESITLEDIIIGKDEGTVLTKKKIENGQFSPTPIVPNLITLLDQTADALNPPLIEQNPDPASNKDDDKSCCSCFSFLRKS